MGLRNEQKLILQLWPNNCSIIEWELQNLVLHHAAILLQRWLDVTMQYFFALWKLTHKAALGGLLFRNNCHIYSDKIAGCYANSISFTLCHIGILSSYKSLCNIRIRAQGIPYRAYIIVICMFHIIFYWLQLNLSVHKVVKIPSKHESFWTFLQIKRDVKNIKLVCVSIRLLNHHYVLFFKQTLLKPNKTAALTNWISLNLKETVFYRFLLNYIDMSLSMKFHTLLNMIQLLVLQDSVRLSTSL